MEMDSNGLGLKDSRRTLAVGVWSSLLAAICLCDATLPFVVSFVLIIVVSLLSGLMLLLVDQRNSRQVPATPYFTGMAISIALIIPLLWSLRLTAWDAPAIRTLMAAVSVTAPGFVAMARSSGTGFPFQGRSTIPADQDLRTQILSTQAGQTDQNCTADPIGKPMTAPPSVPAEATRKTAEEVAPDSSAEPPFAGTLPSILAPSHPDLDDEEVEEMGEEEVSRDVVQWLRRSRTSDYDQIAGGVRVEFAPGERDVIVHLSFCPAFQGVPDVVTEDLDGLGLEIRVAATFPFGARLTVRRTLNAPGPLTPDGTCSCCVGFTATATALRRAA
ncbi:hypothetical protein [Schlesneria sp. DSM 10557]|uniref:hypothetical protein n=1 Tax=Schlesneria sp. DSM 10557 TaxID=3044399 RepID=UPI0035A0BAFA